MRISSAAYLFKQGLRNIWTNRIMSLASFCILVVSLILVGSTVIFTANINSFISDIEGKNEVVIYLTDDADDEYIEQLGQTLRTTDNVGSVTFFSKEEAFADIKKDMPDAEDIFSYLGDESPLPDSYRISIKDISKMSATLMAINSMEHIEKVKAPYDFVNVLTSLRSIISVVTGIVLIALIIVSFVIISNTTRASVSIRKTEIAIMKYVGATNFFIKVPFFVEGMVMGTLAGIAASACTLFGYNALVNVLSTETALFAAMGTTGFIPISSFLWQVIIGYIIIGALISAIGTVISTQKYVKV